MKPPAASPGRGEKHLPAPPGLARLLLLSKSRRGGRSRRAPATSPMFVSRGRGAGRGADAEPSSPKVTCIGQVRMRKGKKGRKGAAAAAGPGPKAVTPEKARGYCRCLKKALLCGGLFDLDRRRRPKAPEPEVERGRRSPWVFSSRDVAVAAAPKQPDPRGDHAEDMVASAGVFGSLEGEEAEELGMNGGDDKEDEEEEAELVSSATTTPPKNALLLMRCRSAPQNRSSPLTSRFPVDAPSPTKDTATAEIATASRASRSPRKAQKVAAETQHEEMQEVVAMQEQEEVGEDDVDKDDDYDEEEGEEMRCSSARPLVLTRCKSEPATTAAVKMAGGTAADATTAGCFWANGGSSGRRRHAPPAGAPVALTSH
ncbi:hypothetical protein ABZP36_030219 [Zizania latifolia]